MAKQKRKKSEQPAPINVTEAIKSAASSLTQVFADANIRDIRLEEVEFIDDENCWLVTLSFLRLIPKEEFAAWERQTQHLVGKDYRREYKSVDVDAQSGEVRSIKIRSLSDGV